VADVVVGALGGHLIETVAAGAIAAGLPAIYGNARRYLAPC
jgi:hypothetical protein